MIQILFLYVQNVKTQKIEVYRVVNVIRVGKNNLYKYYLKINFKYIIKGMKNLIYAKNAILNVKSAYLNNYVQSVLMIREIPIFFVNAK